MLEIVTSLAEVRASLGKTVDAVARGKAAD
jgi:hypothetical protein